MALDLTGLNFFMPVFSFLFVFIIIYAILSVSKILGGSKFANLLISFIMSIIFMSVSSMELYVQTIIPWVTVLIVVVFLVLLVMGFATGDLKKIMGSKFGWIIAIVLILIFLVSAIKVFNPVFHPDLVVTSAEAGTSPGIIQQFKDYFGTSEIMGSVLLLIIAGIVSWVLVKK